MDRVEAAALGDAALTFIWPEDGLAKPSDIAGFAAKARNRVWTGVKAWVPACRTLTAHLDLSVWADSGNGREITENVRRLAERIVSSWVRGSDGEGTAASRHVVLPIVYGGKDGPDLEICAERSGLSEKQFAEKHSSALYEVAMIGFAPGFPYLSGLPEGLEQPRRDSPRQRVAAGSVGVAGGQTCIYPVESPGGWQLIGRTSARLFRPESETPFLLAPGDRVSFVPADSLDESDEPVEAGSKPALEEPVTAMTVVKSGLLSTVQDRGRYDWLAYGVSVGGAMDMDAMRTANELVGNGDRAAVLEMTMSGASFRLERDMLLAVCGADMDADADGVPMPMGTPVWLAAGTMLSFGRAKQGCRAYLAVAGGIDTPVQLGSRSTDVRAGIGGVEGRPLRAGDRLPAGEPSPLSIRLAAGLRAAAVRSRRAWAFASWSAGTAAERAGSVSNGIGGRRPTTIRIMPGAEWNHFEGDGQHRLLSEIYRVGAASDRMGMRLAGPSVARRRSGELTSHGVAAGTMQVPANGQPIILGAACQPTGGYPKIAHVISADLPLVAQCVPGDGIVFKLVDAEEAWEAWRLKERNYRLLRAGVRSKGAAWNDG